MAATMTSWDDFRFEFDDDGTFHMRGRTGFKEAICPKCDQVIRWVIDMSSFSPDGSGGSVLCHARCVWTKAGFSKQARLAVRE